MTGPRVPRRPQRPVRDDRGFVTVWTVALISTCVILVGLVHDAGRALRGRSDAFGSAAAAARAGAQEIDRAAAVQGVTRLDIVAADQRAREYLDARSLSGQVHVIPDTLDVIVTVTDTIDLQILPGSINVRATAEAHAAQGPETP